MCTCQVHVHEMENAVGGLPLDDRGSANEIATRLSRLSEQPITALRIPGPENGEYEGVCFIDIPESPALDKSIKSLNGLKWKGRTLRCARAKHGEWEHRPPTEVAAAAMVVNAETKRSLASTDNQKKGVLEKIASRQAAGVLRVRPRRCASAIIVPTTPLEAVDTAVPPPAKRKRGAAAQVPTLMHFEEGEGSASYSPSWDALTATSKLTLWQEAACAGDAGIDEEDSDESSDSSSTANLRTKEPKKLQKQADSPAIDHRTSSQIPAVHPDAVQLKSESAAALSILDDLMADKEEQLEGGGEVFFSDDGSEVEEICQAAALPEAVETDISNDKQSMHSTVENNTLEDADPVAQQLKQERNHLLDLLDNLYPDEPQTSSEAAAKVVDFTVNAKSKAAVTVKSKAKVIPEKGMDASRITHNDANKKPSNKPAHTQAPAEPDGKPSTTNIVSADVAERAGASQNEKVQVNASWRDLVYGAKVGTTAGLFNFSFGETQKQILQPFTGVLVPHSDATFRASSLFDSVAPASEPPSTTTTTPADTASKSAGGSTAAYLTQKNEPKRTKDSTSNKKVSKPAAASETHHVRSTHSIPSVPAVAAPTLKDMLGSASTSFMRGVSTPQDTTSSAQPVRLDLTPSARKKIKDDMRWKLKSSQNHAIHARKHHKK